MHININVKNIKRIITQGFANLTETMSTKDVNIKVGPHNEEII